MKKILLLIVLLTSQVGSAENLFDINATIKDYDKVYKNAKPLEYTGKNSKGKEYKTENGVLYVFYDKETDKILKLLISKDSVFTNDEVNDLLEENSEGYRWGVFRAYGKEVHAWLREDKKLVLKFIDNFKDIIIAPATQFDLYRYKPGVTLSDDLSFLDSERKEDDITEEEKFDVLVDDESYCAWYSYLTEVTVLGGSSLGFNGQYEGNIYQPNYKYELKGRKALIKKWKEIKQKNPSAKNKSLDELIKVDKAGFMKEYVWDSFKKKFWEKPLGLRLKLYKEWKMKNIPHHHPETHAWLIEKELSKELK